MPGLQPDQTRFAYLSESIFNMRVPWMIAYYLCYSKKFILRGKCWTLISIVAGINFFLCLEYERNTRISRGPEKHLAKT
jgi:hypothetical protein